MQHNAGRAGEGFVGQQVEFERDRNRKYTSAPVGMRCADHNQACSASQSNVNIENCDRVREIATHPWQCGFVHVSLNEKMRGFFTVEVVEIVVGVRVDP